MRILFICRTWPYPPRNGVELPIAELARRLSKNHHVDMVVWGESATGREAEARENISGDVMHIPGKSGINASRILAELIGIEAVYMARGFESDYEKNLEGKAPYDWVWISPLGGLGLLKFCCRNGFRLANNVAIGKNDEKISVDWAALKQTLRREISFDPKRFFRGIRIPLLVLYERRYCRIANLVCMQTHREKAHMEALLGRHVGDIRVATLQNGVNLSVKPVGGASSNEFNILYMTHLDGGRAREAYWFLRGVWPRIVELEPRARLHLVGTPPRNPQAFQKKMGPSVEVRGFVPDLRCLFSGMTLAVVPTPHASGLVNRVRDALVAGLPLVARSGPLSTIDNLVPGRDAVSADSHEEFAKAVTELLNNPERRNVMRHSALKLASTFPCWEETAEKAEALLRAC